MERISQTGLASKQVAFFLLLSLGLAACPQAPLLPRDCDGIPVAEEWIRLGTGEGEFEAFEEDATLERVFGGQGGIHLWASLEGEGFHPGFGWDSPIPTASAEFSIVDDSNGSVVGVGDLDDPLRYLPGGEILAPGNRAILDQSIYDAIYGEESDYCDDVVDEEEPGELCGDALEEHLESRHYVFSATLTDSCGNEATDSKPIYIDF